MTTASHKNEEVALVPPPVSREDGMESWKPALNLPCHMSFSLPVPHFTLGDLLGLQVGSVIDTTRPEGTDVQVLLNDHLIGWAEFEVSGQQIAFRFTELAG